MSTAGAMEGPWTSMSTDLFLWTCIQCDIVTTSAQFCDTPCPVSVRTWVCVWSPTLVNPAGTFNTFGHSSRPFFQIPGLTYRRDWLARVLNSSSPSQRPTWCPPFLSLRSIDWLGYGGGGGEGGGGLLFVSSETEAPDWGVVIDLWLLSPWCRKEFSLAKKKKKQNREEEDGVHPYHICLYV